MDYQALVDYCMTKKGAVQDLPFGPDTLVFKVMGKLFALTGVDPSESPLTVNLKCDPALAEILRRTYPDSVLPGYHMNKRHWNTVVCDDALLADDEIYEMIDNSYALVVKGLRKADREKLEKGEL
jgi:predicted DNA-binding protein (MmcQ/YjbR family)